MLLPRRSHFARGLMAMTLVLGLAGPALAQNLLTVRVESLDDALGDITTIAEAVGQPVSKEDLIAPVLGQLGLEDLSFLDWEAPAALVMPMQGMMLQQNGLLLALPVRDAEAALGALGKQFGSHEDQEGLHVFSAEAGPQLFVTVGDGYLAAGGSRDLVRGFDIGSALVRPDAPSGNLVVDFNVEPIAPMAMMGLMGAKEQVKQQMMGGMASDPNVPEEMKSMMGDFVDMYIDMAGAFINNISHIQMVPEVTDTHVIPHLRFVPKSGGGLANLVAAQKDSWPKLARHVPGNAVLVAAGQVTMTPEAKAFGQKLTQTYLGAMSNMSKAFMAEEQGSAEGEGGEVSHDEAMHAALMNLMGSFPEGLGDLYTRSLDCYTGSMAFAIDLDPGTGFSMTQVEGFNGSKEGCSEIMGKAMGMVRDWLGQAPELASFVNIAPTDGGDWGIDVNIGQHIAGEAPEETMAMLNTLLLDDGTFRVRVGQTNDIAYGLMGKGAASRAGSIDSPAAGGGITADAFSPLGSGAGYFFRLDIGRLLGSLQQIIPEEEMDEDFGKIAQAMSGAAGQIPFAVRFDSGGINLETAISMDAVSNLAAMANQGGGYDDHGHDHGEGDHDHEGHDHGE